DALPDGGRGARDLRGRRGRPAQPASPGGRSLIVEVYTDGSGTVAGQPAGWAFAIVVNGRLLAEDSGRLEDGTNNDAELEAAVRGLASWRERLRAAGKEPGSHGEQVYLVSDSQLV